MGMFFTYCLSECELKVCGSRYRHHWHLTDHEGLGSVHKTQAGALNQLKVNVAANYDRLGKLIETHK